jgi:LysM repeat protein
VGRHSAPERRRRYPLGVRGAAVLTGVATAMVIGGTALEAHADPGINWDAIASCESSGNWAIATGNGYFGGLQWTMGTWRANGGVGNPANASREAQIAVAERIIATQGITRGLQNWPVCGKRAWSAAPKPAPTSPGPTVGGSYTVRAGDTLALIAGAHGTTWEQLTELNHLPNPNLIYPGQQLHMP